MIRILHVLGGLDIGGAETVVMNYYRNIDRSKIQFDFIIHTNEHQAYYDEVLSLGGKVYMFPKFRGRNLFQVKKNWDSFFVNHPEYKILHSHVRSYASVYLPIAKKHGVKTIAHSHSTSNGKGISSFVKKILQYPIRFQADFYMGCSKNAGKWLFGKRIINSDRFIVLHNAIDSSLYAYNKEKSAEIRKKLNIGNEKTYIHVGRFHESKNHLFLVKLFYKIREETKAKLILVGDGPLKQEIEKVVITYGIDKDVIFAGAVSNVYDYYQASDCFLFPSKWEGLGMAVIEAQASGLKCLCSTNVPQEAKITNLCSFISLDDIKNWIDNSIDLNYERTNTRNDIINSGYDIKEAALTLLKFYYSI